MIKSFSAPKSDAEFVKYWNLFLPKVRDRDNFHESHLQQLEILCDMYVDYNQLTKFIRENGYSFSCDSRYGTVSRPHSEVQTRQKIVGEIRAYTKMLGLVLDKGLPNGEEETEWD